MLCVEILEYRTHFLTKAFGGRRQLACYALAITIFSLGLVRDAIYERALAAQLDSLSFRTYDTYLTPLALFLIASGLTLVLTSTWALGITGTYLGDYFGMLMPAKVTSFPFNLTGAPMYYGSAMQFLGYALWKQKPAGLILSAWVLIVYSVALRYEDPFTEGIYERAGRQQKSGNRSGKASGSQRITRSSVKKQ